MILILSGGKNRPRSKCMLVIDMIRPLGLLERGLTWLKRWSNYYHSKIHSVRFADDFIITAEKKEFFDTPIPFIYKYLSERGVSLNREKTKIFNIEDGFVLTSVYIRCPIDLVVNYFL